MQSFYDSELCKSRRKCLDCRANPKYRKGIILSFDEPKDVDFECPHGINEKELVKERDEKLKKLKEKIERNKKVPSKTDMAKSFASSMLGEAKAIISKKEKTTLDEAESRINICRGVGDDKPCAFWAKDKCTKCGCFLVLKTKLRTGSCPIGKW